MAPLDRLAAVAHLVLEPGDPIVMAHPQAVPIPLKRPLTTRTLAVMLDLLREGWTPLAALEPLTPRRRPLACRSRRRRRR